MTGIPILHENVTIHENDNKIITLKMKVVRGSTFFDRFRPPVTERSYELDEFGSFVVCQIDSKKHVLDIIYAFERRFGMNHREAELGVVAFMKMLMKRNVLSVVIDKPR